MKHRQYIDDVRERVIKILVAIFNGDMIEVYAALAAIYPGSWKRELNEDELIYVSNIERRKNEKY